MTPLAAGAPPYFGNPAGPAFAGDGIVWATQRLGGGGFDVTLDRGGSLETEDVPTTARTKRLTNTLDAEIAASSTHTALAVAIDRCTDASGCKYGDYETVEADVFAGPLAQPLTLRGCAGGVTEAGGGFESMDMSASVLAYLDGYAGGAVVRDLAAGAGRRGRCSPRRTRCGSPVPISPSTHSILARSPRTSLHSG